MLREREALRERERNVAGTIGSGWVQPGCHLDATWVQILVVWLGGLVDLLGVSMAAAQAQMGTTIAAWDSALAHMTAQLTELEAIAIAPSRLNALATAHQQVLAAHQLLTQAIATLDVDPHADPDAAVLAARFGAIALEMHKQMRLLQTDQQFLQAARRPETVAQRRSQIQERLTLLQRYGDGMRSLLMD